MSTCHWCHVMERESFEDEEVAALLNAHFVAVKVDREERPDIDHIYMAVCQAMTGHGGWPLTVFMTPDKKPFFVGTYFPKERKYGRPGLMDILRQVAEKWAEERERIIEVGKNIAEAVKHHQTDGRKGEISETLLHDAFQAYAATFDSRYGGFGDAPKFPASHNLSFLLRYYKRTGKKQALDMVEKTLDAMWRGGIYDHIGYGFSRYSTDGRWLVPHFEKMLYDNALLMMTYAEAYQVTGKPRYKQIAGHIAEYVLRDMTGEGGAFHSAEDADSEGEEGKFYVWTPEEVRETLGREDGDWYCELYGITERGNFEGRSIPNLIAETPEEFAERKGIPAGELQHKIEEARRKLFASRERRIRPHKDDKILTSWNGLMIMALAKAAKALHRPEYAVAAARAADFVLNTLRRPDGRLLARYRDGEAALPAYLDDYAFLAWGLTELYEAAFEPERLRQAAVLGEEMIRLFWDGEAGGFFFYGTDSEQLLTRPKEIYDGAMPSGNSVAALTLLKLSKFTGREDFAQIAGRQLAAFAGTVQQYPPGYSMFLSAVDFALGPGKEIVIAGEPEKEDTRRMVQRVHQQFLPEAIVVQYPPGKAGEQVRRLIPLVRDKVSLEGKATAYVCENYACQSPTTEINELERLITART